MEIFYRVRNTKEWNFLMDYFIKQNEGLQWLKGKRPTQVSYAEVVIFYKGEKDLVVSRNNGILTHMTYPYLRKVYEPSAYAIDVKDLLKTIFVKTKFTPEEKEEFDLFRQKYHGQHSDLADVWNHLAISGSLDYPELYQKFIESDKNNYELQLDFLQAFVNPTLITIEKPKKYMVRVNNTDDCFF